MPNYRYTHEETGETIEMYFAMTDRPKSVTQQGKVYVRDVAAEMNSRKSEPGSHWPMHSDAMGVHPDQVDQMQNTARKCGVPTEWCRKTGRAKLTSPRHKKQVMKALGFVDFDGN